MTEGDPEIDPQDSPTEETAESAPAGQPDDAQDRASAKTPAWHLHRRLYDWVLHWADTPYGGVALFILSFAESSCFPVPPDVLLIPLVIGNRKKWFRFALICSIASILGGMLGYLIGFGAWGAVDNLFFDHIPGFTRDTIATADGKEIACLVETAGDQARPWTAQLPSKETLTLPDAEVAEIHYGTYSKVRQRYEEYNFWVVFTAGFTPLPYKVITITAGVFRINFVVFLIASAVSRSARFFLVAGLFWLFGPVIKPFIDKYFNLLCFVFMVLLIGGFVVLKYL